MTTLREATGKPSFARGMGAVIVIFLLVGFCVALLEKNWETVRWMAGELSLLAAGLYGFNKLTGIWQQPQAPAAQPQGQPKE